MGIFAETTKGSGKPRRSWSADATVAGVWKLRPEVPVQASGFWTAMLLEQGETKKRNTTCALPGTGQRARGLDAGPSPVTLLFLAKPSPLGFRLPKSGRSAPNSQHFLISDFSLTGADGPYSALNPSEVEKTIL